MSDKTTALEVLEGEKGKPLATVSVDTTKTVKRTRATGEGPHETVLQSLRRIMGDRVLDLIPSDVQEAVEAAYVFWKDHSDSYLVTPFDTETDRNDALTVMKAYAEIAPDGPYTIRVDKNSEPHILHWRAQTRQGRQSSEA